MQLTEQHIIDRKDPRFAAIDTAAFASKNLYNAALYEIRQAFIHHGTYLSYSEMNRRMQSHEAYKALPAKVSQQVLRQLDDAWTSFFEAVKAYNEDPSKFCGRPRLPKYKDKTEGRNVLVYTLQALSGGQTLHKSRGRSALRHSIIKPSMLPIEVKTQQDPKTIDQVRIVPRNGFYVLEVVYEYEQPKSAVDPAYYAGIDVGMDNLAALRFITPWPEILSNFRPGCYEPCTTA